MIKKLTVVKDELCNSSDQQILNLKLDSAAADHDPSSEESPSLTDNHHDYGYDDQVAAFINKTNGVKSESVYGWNRKAPIKTEDDDDGRKKISKQKELQFIPDEDVVKRYRRQQQGEGGIVSTARYSKNQKFQQKLKQQERLQNEAVKRLAVAELLLTQTQGYLVADENERTDKIAQYQILQELDVESSSKAFDLRLSFGPYKTDITRNGRYLLIGGSKGSLSIIDLLLMKSFAETNVRETIRDICFLQNETMFAAAQKKYLYIYDNSGIELHCLRSFNYIHSLTFLPFHYLLASIGEFGRLRYLDISTGAEAAEHQTARGPCAVMCQNPHNAVVHLGHVNGCVTQWTPSQDQPVACFPAHRGKVTAMQCFQQHYCVTAGNDGKWKIWDLRKFDSINSYHYFGCTPSTISVSQTGLIALNVGARVQIWKDVHLVSNNNNEEEEGERSRSLAAAAAADSNYIYNHNSQSTAAAAALKQQRPKSPYMQHLMNGECIESVKFRPYEDFCIIGTSKRIQSIVVPGSCIANYDAYSADPYESKKQRSEREVKSLLEKLPAETITIDPNKIGTIDEAPETVLAAEEEEAHQREVLNLNLGGRKAKKKSMKEIEAMKQKRKFEDLKKKVLEKRLKKDSALKNGDENANKSVNDDNDDDNDVLDRFKRREKPLYF